MTADRFPPRPSLHRLPERDSSDPVLAAVKKLADSVLSLEHNQGRMMAELGRISQRLMGVESSGMWRAASVIQGMVDDPTSPVTADRARQLAEEAIRAARRDSDANKLRALKAGGKNVAVKLLELLIAAAVGALAAHYGLH